jgi:hypothetical protein
MSSALVPLLVSLLAAGSGQPSGIPVPHGTMPPAITLVGTNAGVPLGVVGPFVVNVRDQANNTLGGVPVVVDLSACGDLELCADQHDPAALVNCASKTVRKFTNVAGDVTFNVLGSSHGVATTGLGGGKVYAGGVLIGTLTVTAPDLDGVGGVGINDLSLWLGDFGSHQTWGRSDFDYSGTLGVNDLSVWLTIYGETPWTASCGFACP